MKILKRSRGFTLVELVITIAIVIILSVISVPIYRGYVDKAKWSEGYALCGLILSAQKAYYSEYGNFLRQAQSVGETCYEPILGIDARGNKYFTCFYACWYGSPSEPKTYYFDSRVNKPIELQGTGGNYLYLLFNTTKGAKISDVFDSSWKN